MDWTNERYVRLYTRDTDDWLVLSWQAKALFSLMLRKVDRSGFLDTKREAIGVAAQTGLPIDVVEVGLSDLLRDGSVTKCDGGFLMPNYIEAQEAPQSDAQRSRELRERRRDRKSSHNVTDAQRIVDKPSLQPDQPSLPSKPAVAEAAAELTPERRVVIAANQVIGKRFPNHDQPHTPGHGGTTDLIQVITAAHIPIEFAERAIATQASKLRAPVKTMAYFTPGILEAWAKNNAKNDADAAPRVLPLNGRNESRVPSRGPSPPVPDDNVICRACGTTETQTINHRTVPKHNANCHLYAATSQVAK